MLMLGIDTSCDDTSCAVIRDGCEVLSNVVSSQVDLHAVYGGVVPEIASRRHLETMVPVLSAALSAAGVSKNDLDAVSVTAGPGLLGSLFVGVSFGKSLAAGLGLPLCGVQHLEGHIAANFLREDIPDFPLLNLVVSGGHSDLVLMTGHGAYQVLGETRDDAAGEVFDKVAREMGLPFPGGPHMDGVAESGDEDAYHFPHPKMVGRATDFSFSGLKTRALQYFEAGGKSAQSVPHLSASFRKAVVEQLLYHVEDLVMSTGAKAVAISGGVAANKLLRKRAGALCREIAIPLFIPPKDLCTDNGAMVAAAGHYRLQAGKTDGPDLDARSGLPLLSWKSAGEV